MFNPNRKKMLLINSINESLIDLPTPSTINYWWNFGSLLGLCLIIQFVTGLLLAIHYTASTESSFDVLSNMTRNVNYMWMIRIIHANGASLFFFFIYLHIGRGILNKSFLYKNMWYSGILILLTLMATAFLGYVLPWGQMSFWAATVITNLLSALPYFGTLMVEWMWGGFSVNNPTLTRFFCFHFFLPFLLSLMAIFHILMLHSKGSSNPLGLTNHIDKISFHPFYNFKDLLFMIFSLTIFVFLLLSFPYLLIDPENFIMANPMSTPTHIQPEWYFLFAYAILRAIPNKLGGVISLISSILFTFILLNNNCKIKFNLNFSLYKFLTWLLFSFFFMLSWLGSQTVDYPYDFLSQLYTFFYFCSFIVLSIL